MPDQTEDPGRLTKDDRERLRRNTMSARADGSQTQSWRLLDECDYLEAERDEIQRSVERAVFEFADCFGRDELPRMRQAICKLAELAHIKSIYGQPLNSWGDTGRAPSHLVDELRAELADALETLRWRSVEHEPPPYDGPYEWGGFVDEDPGMTDEEAWCVFYGNLAQAPGDPEFYEWWRPLPPNMPPRENELLRSADMEDNADELGAK